MVNNANTKQRNNKPNTVDGKRSQPTKSTPKKIVEERPGAVSPINFGIKTLEELMRERDISSPSSNSPPNGAPSSPTQPSIDELAFFMRSGPHFVHEKDIQSFSMINRCSTEVATPSKFPSQNLPHKRQMEDPQDETRKQLKIENDTPPSTNETTPTTEATSTDEEDIDLERELEDIELDGVEMSEEEMERLLSEEGL
ncbi:hypothetical protein PROFUN_08276 [Planoprotostelium fungivorum]|uniref:Uncharacterized protein n=1 Tax=Planoprotostelium fungivorum TaxID=1890364 RepID=A0A2P6NJZ4_9EUKA|nr:hypothetical protein PROFUN_08276 [Planoprotostelium fungivorum]